jgi:hypothetical protein
MDEWMDGWMDPKARHCSIAADEAKASDTGDPRT